MHCRCLTISVLVSCALLSSAAAETIAQPAQFDAPQPLGTTLGMRPERLVIRGATMVTGRGTPGSGRAAQPEGPVDIVVEECRIVNIIPIDTVSVAGGLSERTTGDLGLRNER